MMRKLLVAGCLSLLLPAVAKAQITSESPSAGALPAQFAAVPSAVVGAAQGPFLGRAPTRRCCSRKGALIGLAVGAAGGIVSTLYLCDAGDCTSTYFKSIGVLGGVGTVIGAFTA